MNGTICSDIPHTRRIKILDLNPHLMCVLCGGYYIDATTIIECLHSFCKTCIVRYLETSKFCPICDVQVHKTKPLLNIRSDQTLQDIVYKLVPGLFQREMKRRRDFYANHPNDDKNSRSNEERGEVESEFPRNLFKPDDVISISLEYSESGGISNSPDKNEHNEKSQTVCRRYLKCPVFITVAHIKKLIRAKYSLAADHRIDILFSQDNLNDDYMLMDIAYMYAWKRKGPLKLFFRIFERPAKRLKTYHSRTPLFGLERFRHSVAPHPIPGKKLPESVNKPSTTPDKTQDSIGEKPETEIKKLKDESETTPTQTKPSQVSATSTQASTEPQLNNETKISPETVPCINNNNYNKEEKKEPDENEKVKTIENVKKDEKSGLAQSLANGSATIAKDSKDLKVMPEKVNGITPTGLGLCLPC